MDKGYGTLRASAIVFLASACTMVLELVAGRILAPYIGVSLYTWTSIIGVVLAGIALGNYLGGRLGDKYGSPFLLTCIFFAGGLASLAILPETIILNTKPLPGSFHLMTRSTLYTLLLFFLPTFVLGMVTPVVIKLNLNNVQRTGRTVGTIYAVSTFGAILGTFATGFVLISSLGTRAILWGVAIVLLITGGLVSAWWKQIAKWGLTVFVLVAYVAAFTWRESYAAPVMRESNYYSINISEIQNQGRTVKYLALDALIHSYIDPKDPVFLGYAYEKTFAQMAEYESATRPDFRTLFIGGGGYSFSRYLETEYPSSQVEVAEIDPAVTETVYDYLALPRTTRIKTTNSDARIFLMDRPGNPKFDIVVGDAFNDKSVPYHLTTYEFNEVVKSHMSDDGIYMVNVIDDMAQGRFLVSLMRTLRESFQYVYLHMPENAQVLYGPGTYVIVASNAPIDAGRYQTAVDKVEHILIADNQDPISGSLVQMEDLPPGVPINTAVFLTDDFVPVDNMIAPLFAH